MQGMNSTLRGVTHDINHVMAHAMIMAEQLRHHPDTQVVEKALRISDAIDRASTIWRQGVSQETPSNNNRIMHKARIEKLLGSLVDLVEIESKFNGDPIVFRFGVEMNQPIFLDDTKLFRLVFNLVLNAANAISEFGGKQIKIAARRSKSNLSICVVDDGPGLPAGVATYLKGNLTDQSPDSFPSCCGTGLPTALGLARDMEGHIDLVSTSNEGTHLCIKLPAVQGSRLHPSTSENDKGVRHLWESAEPE